jgi:hypothetical protein
LSRPISSRDKERFGIIQAEKTLGAVIEYWLFPSINDLNFTRNASDVELITNKTELRKVFARLPSEYEIFLVFPFTSNTLWIHKEFSKSRIAYNYLKLYSNEVPFLTAAKSMLFRLRFIHLRGCKQIFSCRNYSIFSASPFFLMSLTSKIILVPSADWNEFQKASTRNNDSSTSGSGYLVFLDSFLEGHPDFAVPLVEDSSRYWHRMNSILNGYSQKFNLRVIIKEHPKRTSPIPIDSFLISKETTANLIAGSALVLCHATTAISFVTLAKIPLVQIRLDSLCNSGWYANWIMRVNKVLKSKIIGITDEDSDFEIPKIDYDQYSYYVKKHHFHSHHSVQNYAEYLIK